LLATIEQPPGGGHMDHGNRPALLTVEQAADRLGLAPSTVRTWVARKRIDYVKVGGAVRITDQAVDEIVARGTVHAATRVA
jgi:excisionase family DNA binding protein